jgi:hypothetical protein
MKPLNINKAGCTNMSSNCVIWEGPDIPCISLCKGDTITDVVYKLATELCKVLEIIDLDSYDLKCFKGGVCQPADFQAFMQLIIDKICALESCSPCANTCSSGGTPVVTPPTGGLTSNSTLKVAPAFHYKNQFGDNVTTMTVDEYATAIGNKVYNQITSIATIQNSLSDYNKRIQALETVPAPTFELPKMTPTGVLPKVASDMLSVVQAMEAQFVQHKNALGTPNQIYTNIQKQIPNLNDAKSLANPGMTMSSITGWNTTTSNHADSLGNLWLTVADMRNAIQNIITNYMPNDCAAISLKMQASYKNNNIVVYTTGEIPASFVNTYSKGTKFTITDTKGNSMTTFIDILSFLNKIDGKTINLEGSVLMGSTDFSIVAEPNFTNKVTGSQCQSYLQHHIITKATCPFTSYIPGANTVTFNFTSESGMRTYTVELWEQTGTEALHKQSFTTTSVQPVNGTFAALEGNTNYKVRVLVNTDGVITTCEFSAIKTI